MNIHAKCDVSSSNRSRDMEGGHTISKVGHVTPFRFVCGQKPGFSGFDKNT